MKISLSLCLSLSVISSVLVCADSNPFDQKRPDAQEEIKQKFPSGTSNKYNTTTAKNCCKKPRKPQIIVCTTQIFFQR